MHTTGFEELKSVYSEKKESFEIKEAFKFILDKEIDLEDLDLGFAHHLDENSSI